MDITKELVLKVANLANLRLADSEVDHYQKQLANILGYVDQLKSVKDDLGKEWRADTLGPATPEREDIVQPSLTPEEALAAAPQKIGSAFQVPRIIE